MYTQLKIKCLHDFEDRIHTTDKSCFTRNDHSMRLSYRVGSELKYINLPTREEAAKFLKEHGIIETFIYTANGIVMYEKILVVTSDHRGRPVQNNRMVSVEWEKLKLNAAQVITIAARHEWNETSKVFRIGSYFMNAA